MKTVQNIRVITLKIASSLRSRVTELERRLSQLEAENAQLRSRDYSLQLA